MRAIVVEHPGGPGSMVWSEAPEPVAGEGEVVIDVAAAGVNRADTLQRQGFYPPPKGGSPIIGMEVSGTVGRLGPGVTTWSVGEQVCALLGGGGYAERVAVPAGQLLPVPDGVDLVTAAALPEVACTVHSNLGHLLHEGELLLVHGGSSGIGTFAIQYARARGARVAVTAGSAEKLERCRALGAEMLVNYREQDFVEVVGQADVVLDSIGAKYLARNVSVLAPNGRLVVIGLQGGTKAELDIGALVSKRASVRGTMLRGRPLAEKAQIVRSVRDEVWPLIGHRGEPRDGHRGEPRDEHRGEPRERHGIEPVVDSVVPIAEAARAHARMESSAHVGKILLAI